MFKSMWFSAPAITAFVAGQPSTSTLLNGRKTYAVGMEFAATCTVAGGALTAIVNGGSLLACFDEVGFMDNGIKRIQMDPRAAGFLTGALFPSARTRTVLSSTANGVTALRETVILFFGMPYQLDPWETAYVESDPKNNLQAYAIPNASITAGTAIGTVGAGTIAITAPSITVTQYYNLDLTTQPMLRVYTETRDFAVTSSGAGQEQGLRTDRYLGGLFWLTDSVQGGVRVQDTTILTALAVRSDPRFLIGENPVPITAFNAFNDQWCGESLVGTPAAYARFVEFGRLSTVVDPRVDSNLRALYTANPSTVGGATSSRIRCALLGYERVAGVTAKVVPFLDGAEAVAVA